MSLINAKQIDLTTLASADTNSLVQVKSDGLYMALQAAENVQIQYVSSSTGNDSNSGTRAAPLKTLYRALERLPDSTQGQIYLMEGDTFPMRTPSDPQTWGGAVTYFGRVMSSSLKTLLISAYGPQSDYYDSLNPGSLNFNTFCLATKYLTRPILEFGHYMFNGAPVGTALILGQNGGAGVTLRNVDVRFTDGARAACTSSGKSWTSQGYNAPLCCANVDMQGVLLPSPITSGSTVLAYSVIAYGRLNPWQVYVPVETSYWLNLSGVNEVSFGNTGTTITGNNGVTYDTVSSTVETNLSTRSVGVIKDSNGFPRNVTCNLAL